MLRKIFLLFFIILSSFGIAVLIYPYSRSFLLKTGVLQVRINIAGTGSMYPTFPKGTGENEVVNAKEIVAWPKMMAYPSGFSIFGRSILSYSLKHSDIVEFENEKTRLSSLEKYGEEAGFVKRVIALPGDELVLRDGFVYLNGSMIEEPYTAKPRSTYGGNSIPDCKPVKIPEGFVAVMGDNRKASQDSRYEIGLVPMEDIHFVLPFDKQDEYRPLWRDASKDGELEHTTTLSQEEFLSIINSKRREAKVKPLKISPGLTVSSARRGKVMIDTDDFSTEATRSGVGMEKAVREAGYRNIILAESSTVGYYDAPELVDNFLEFPQTKKILLSGEYQDIGIAPVLGEIRGCPTQVIVIHLGGYKPPNWSKSEIESWGRLIENINRILPSWENYSTSGAPDMEKAVEIANLLKQRKSNAEKILKRMKANEWLNDEEEKLGASDKELAERIEKLVGEMNQQ